MRIFSVSIRCQWKTNDGKHVNNAQLHGTGENSFVFFFSFDLSEKIFFSFPITTRIITTEKRIFFSRKMATHILFFSPFSITLYLLSVDVGSFLPFPSPPIFRRLASTVLFLSPCILRVPNLYYLPNPFATHFPNGHMRKISQCFFLCAMVPYFPQMP